MQLDVICVLAACVSVLPLIGAEIHGTVTVSRTRAPWADAVLILAAPGERHQTTPESDGTYVFNGLNGASSYRLSVSAEGFRAVELGPFRLDVIPVMQVDVGLELAT